MSTASVISESNSGATRAIQNGGHVQPPLHGMESFFTFKFLIYLFYNHNNIGGLVYRIISCFFFGFNGVL